MRPRPGPRPVARNTEPSPSSQLVWERPSARAVANGLVTAAAEASRVAAQADQLAEVIEATHVLILMAAEKADAEFLGMLQAKLAEDLTEFASLTGSIVSR